MCNTETSPKKIENGGKLLELEYIIRNPLKFVIFYVSRGKNNLFFHLQDGWWEGTVVVPKRCKDSERKSYVA